MTSWLSRDYDTIYTNVPLYSKRRRLIGEVDILAKKEGKFDIFEVKCSFRIHKARKQLARIKRIISRTNKVRDSFFFCGESGHLVKITPIITY